MRSKKYPISAALADFILNNNPAKGTVLIANLNEEKDNLLIGISDSVNTDVKE